jgi:cytidyltransferase-like protein
MKVGLFGGSFNPVHFGHVGLAKWVIEHTDLDELWLLVSPNNPLKPADMLTPEEQRLEAVRKAVKDIPQEELVNTILLAHHPEYIDNGAELGIPLTLTGHTHGGQVGIFGLPLIPVYKYNRGFVKLGASLGYVHSGNGSWLPLRIGCPPEIAYFRLVD